MSKLRWQLLLVALALVAIALLLLARQPILRNLFAQPGQGGVYIEGLVGSIGRLNPLLDGANPADQDIDRLIFSGLLKFDERGNPQPDLAESWGISLDGLDYNFTLRENLTWQDGEPLTAQDIVFTIDLLRNQDLPIPEDIRTLWSKVEATALDDRHLQFRLPSAFAPFLDYLSFGVLPKHLLSELDPGQLVNAPFNLKPIGSGPYEFQELLSENNQVTGVVLKAWDAYPQGRAFIDQIIFHYYSTSSDAYQAYKTGDIMGISYISPELLPQVLADPTLNVYSTRLPRLSIVMLNLDSAEAPFFKEQQVRQALLQGINRQWIIDNYLDGQAFIADGPILPGTWAYNESLGTIPYDPDKAISILKLAGYTIPAEGGDVRSKDGVSLEFELVHPDTELHTRIAESIRDNLAELGIKVDLVAVPYDKLVTDYLQPRNYQAALVDLNLARSADPDPYPFWHQAEITGGQNYSKWDDRRASEYLEQARVSINQSTRAKLYRNFQSEFARELPSLPLYFPVYSYAISVQVRGVSMGPIFQSSDRFATLTQWFLVTASQVNELEPTVLPEISEPSQTP
jgi:peptide/nickel transport system substrate-binding protein